jgi:hypothetical protein
MLLTQLHKTFYSEKLKQRFNNLSFRGHKDSTLLYVEPVLYVVTILLLLLLVEGKTPTPSRINIVHLL